MPKVYITENPQPNAFATGRNPEHAAVCVTSGLLAQVNNEELAGVIAHELGHVKKSRHADHDHHRRDRGRHRHAGQFRFLHGRRRRNNPLGLVGMLLVTLLAPIAAMLVQAAISRSPRIRSRPRRRRTDRPAAVAGQRAGRDRHMPRQRIDNAPADANPATAHMFIINPLHGGMSGLFASHPSTEERIARLRAMAGGMRSRCRKRTLGLKTGL